MFELRTPGVYVRNVEPVPSIEGLRTDVTAFVGIAERGPLHEAVHIDDWERFVERFGTFRPGAFLAYTVKAYFDNGGRDAWIVRVADLATATKAVASIEGQSSGVVRAVVSARNEGVWGQRLTVRIVHSVAATTVINSMGQVTSIASISPGSLVRLTPNDATAITSAFVERVDAARSRVTLLDGALVPASGASLEVLVFSLSVYEDGRVVEHFPGLSPSSRPVSPTAKAAPTAASVAALGSSRIVFDDSSSTLPELPVEGDYALSGGRDGIDSLIPEHVVGFAYRARELGLQCLDAVDQVAMVAIPDAVARPRELNGLVPPPPQPEPCTPCEPPLPAQPVGNLLPELEMPPHFDRAQVLAMQRALLAHCETHRDRFALLDPHDPALARSELLSWRLSFDSSYGAAYYPWLEIVDPLSPTSAAPYVVPPCGHVAGCYAKTDLAKGVHVVGANQPLAWTSGPRVAIGDAEQADLNPQSINCIRAFPGRGARIYGARTLSSDATLRYVNVRRLLMMMAEALEEQLAWAVFEANDGLLRRKVSLTISGFLRALYSAGAFAGATEAESYFVRCDEVTNPPDALARGELHALLGVAIVRPAEFVLLTVGRSDERLEVEEGGKPWR